MAVPSHDHKFYLIVYLGKELVAQPLNHTTTQLDRVLKWLKFNTFRWSSFRGGCSIVFNRCQLPGDASDCCWVLHFPASCECRKGGNAASSSSSSPVRVLVSAGSTVSVTCHCRLRLAGSVLYAEFLLWAFRLMWLRLELRCSDILPMNFNEGYTQTRSEKKTPRGK